MTTDLYLIRHGDYLEDDHAGKYQDLGLSAEGIRQTEQLRDRLMRTKEIAADVLIASSLRRAQESAALLAPIWGTLVTVDQDFEEWRCEDGSLTPEEFNARWQQVPVSERPFFRWVAGYETWLEFSVRIQQALNRIAQEHAGKTVVMLTHGGVIQAAFEYFFGYGLATQSRVTIQVQNASITHWFKSEHQSRWVLERFNDYHHG